MHESADDVRVALRRSPALSPLTGGAIEWRISRNTDGFHVAYRREAAMIADYEIRLASPADATAISSLSREAIEHGLAWNWTPRRVAQCMADPATNVVVARQQGKVIGFAIMSYGDEHAHIQLFAVHSVYRRRGLGSALLSWLEQTARVAGITWIRLEARTGNEQARAFYRRRGFIEVGVREGYYQGVEDAVRMTRNLRLRP